MCACVSLVFCSLASVPPVFVVRVCSCGCLLRCLAVLPLSLCPLALSPLFFTFDGRPSQELEKSLNSPMGVLYLATPVNDFPKEGARKKCRSTMEIQYHVTDTRAPVACWMLPCSKQGRKTSTGSTFWYLSVHRLRYVTSRSVWRILYIPC